MNIVILWAAFRNISRKRFYAVVALSSRKKECFCCWRKLLRSKTEFARQKNLFVFLTVKFKLCDQEAVLREFFNWNSCKPDLSSRSLVARSHASHSLTTTLQAGLLNFACSCREARDQLLAFKKLLSRSCEQPEWKHWQSITRRVIDDRQSATLWCSLEDVFVCFVVDDVTIEVASRGISVLHAWLHHARFVYSP